MQRNSLRQYLVETTEHVCDNPELSLNIWRINMAKNKTPKKHDQLLDFNFAEELPDDEVIADMMVGLIEASNHQQRIAIELTKLVVEKSTQTMDEEKIFLAFKRASKVVIESFPLKELWEKFS
jgi:hypothetical protein